MLFYGPKVALGKKYLISIQSWKAWNAVLILERLSIIRLSAVYKTKFYDDKAPL